MICEWPLSEHVPSQFVTVPFTNIAEYFDSPDFRGLFSKETWVIRYQNVSILDSIGLELRMMEVMMTTGAIGCAKLHSNCHHHQARRPSCCSTGSVRAVKRK